jgi:hypothetical protein
MNAPLVNPAASVRQRLSNLAKERNEDFEQLLVRYALERLLYRLSVSPYRERDVRTAQHYDTGGDSRWPDRRFRARQPGRVARVPAAQPPQRGGARRGCRRAPRLLHATAASSKAPSVKAVSAPIFAERIRRFPSFLFREAGGGQDLREALAEVAVGEEYKLQAARSYNTACSPVSEPRRIARMQRSFRVSGRQFQSAEAAAAAIDSSGEPG